MSIKVQCSCGRWLKARDEFAGKRCHCPTCAKVLRIPEAGESVAAGGGAAPTDAASLMRSEPMEIHEYLDPPGTPVATGSPETAVQDGVDH